MDCVETKVSSLLGGCASGELSIREKSAILFFTIFILTSQSLKLLDSMAQPIPIYLYRFRSFSPNTRHKL
jgi:hypothetical protein